MIFSAEFVNQKKMISQKKYPQMFTACFYMIQLELAQSGNIPRGQVSIKGSTNQHLFKIKLSPDF